jgi:hypothetical protein
LNVLRGPSRYFHENLVDPPTKNYAGIVTFGYLAALALVVVLAVFFFRQLSWPLLFFVVGTALIPLLSGSMFSYYRYPMIPLLPMMVLATRRLSQRPLWRDSALLALARLAISTSWPSPVATGSARSLGFGQLTWCRETGAAPAGDLLEIECEEDRRRATSARRPSGDRGYRSPPAPTFPHPTAATRWAPGSAASPSVPASALRLRCMSAPSSSRSGSP